MYSLNLSQGFGDNAHYIAHYITSGGSQSVAGGTPEVLRPFREPMRSKLRNCSISCLFHPPAPRSSSGASCWMQRRCVWLSHPAVSKCWVQTDPRLCKHNRSIPNTRQTSTFFFFFLAGLSSMWEFSGQESNPHHSNGPSHTVTKPDPNHEATRELLAQHFVM